MLGREEVQDMSTWYRIIQDVDANGDGVIDLKEFEQLLLTKF
jgi:hypothetical protein